MAYVFDWLDEDRHILMLRLMDPIEDYEVEELKQLMEDVLIDPRPLFALVDVEYFNLMTAYSQLGSLLDSLTMPGEEQARASRIAVIGGGTLIKMVLSLAGDALEGEEAIQVFKHEDLALSWLRDSADAAGVT